MLSLRKFLDAAYALLVEEYQRMGIDLLTAIEKLGSFSIGVKEPGTNGEIPVEAPPPSERSVISQNQSSMAMLEQMMAGTK